MWFGVHNVAATGPHLYFTIRLFETVKEVKNQSVATRADTIVITPLTDPSRIDSGFREYQEMCADCHSAPGREPATIRKGLNPKPPRLTKNRVQQRRDAELYSGSWTKTSKCPACRRSVQLMIKELMEHSGVSSHAAGMEWRRVAGKGTTTGLKRPWYRPKHPDSDHSH